MSETNNSDKSLGAAPAKATLHLKRPVEQGTVRQSFSHGRSKAVVVEKVKRRILTPGEAAAAGGPARPEPAPPAAAPAQGAAAPAKPILTAAARPALAAPAKPAAAPPPKTGVVLPTLTAEQREARNRALLDARAREEEDRRRQEAEAEARREREARDRLEREAAEARKREEEVRRAQEANFKRQSEDEARRRLSGGEPAPSPSIPRAPQAVPGVAPGVAAPATLARAAGGEEDEGRRVARRPALVLPGQKVVVPTPRPPRGGEQRNRGRLTVASATAGEEERTRSVASFRRRTQRLKGHGAQDQKEKIAREIVLPEAITIQELASRMSERAVDVIKLLMRQGRMVTLTDVLDADTAELVAEEMGHSVKRVAESDVEEGLFDRPDDEGAPVPRPPIVTIMGHVDHGKTSLLDAIRNANVVAGEAGGITQHIGAYQVIAPGGQKITFVDTPGHAAFTAMRARGAKVTDIVVLVVAADDGVMPQTIEAIRHAKAAKAPIIVAINKIDKPEANPQRVMQELLQHDVQVEAFGGDTLAVEVSATKNINLDKLLEAIALQAELLDLVADPDRSGEGTVIEARLDRGRGPVATVLVQRGTLRVGQLVVAGSHWGRVRALIDDTGGKVESAGPSTPVEVLGFSGAPEAGDRVAVVETEARAREITEYRERLRREKLAARGPALRTSLSDMMSNLKAAGRKELPIVLKGDVQGSVEAITAAVEKLGNDEVVARVIHGGVGGVTESDVTLAEASKAVILGFNVRAHKEARDLAEQAGIEIRYYNIIYNLVDDVKAALSGMLAPTLRETMLGNAQILELFHISKVGVVAGCRVTDGVVQRGAHVRLIRDNVVVHEGKLSTLKRFKDEVPQVQAGQECGMAFENYQDMRVGDVIECYNVEEIRRTL
ncbi:MAG TPA: translation initiation factor IF-2 [Roseiarcus sp.]|nr:translation initiation factor IF-2 [Roseiarcus sp.]